MSLNDDIIEQINELIDVKEQIVTYKKLSIVSNISVNKAKTILKEYINTRNDLTVIIALIGVKKNLDNETVQISLKLCNLIKINEIKRLFKYTTSEHIYSISKCKILCHEMLYSNEKLEDINKNVHFQAIPAIKLDIFDEKFDSSLEQMNDYSFTILKPAATAQFILNKNEKIDNASIKEIKNDNSENIKEKIKTGKTENIKKENKDCEKKELPTLKESKDNIIKTLLSDNDRNLKNILSKHNNIKDKRKNTNYKNKEKTIETKKLLKLKRNRIMIDSSSDEDNINYNLDNNEKESMIEQNTVIIKPKKKVQHLITKTFENSEGYMVTEKVLETDENASEDEVIMKEKKVESKPLTIKTKKKKIPQNQSTLTSFFKKC